MMIMDAHTNLGYSVHIHRVSYVRMIRCLMFVHFNFPDAAEGNAAVNMSSVYDDTTNTFFENPTVS